MIKIIRVGDVVGFRTFSKAIRYGEVTDLLVRGEGGRPTRKDEISIRLKPDNQVVMVQRWRIAERYDQKRLAPGKVTAGRPADERQSSKQ